MCPASAAGILSSQRLGCVLLCASALAGLDLHAGQQLVNPVNCSRVAAFCRQAVVGACGAAGLSLFVLCAADVFPWLFQLAAADCVWQGVRDSVLQEACMGPTPAVSAPFQKQPQAGSPGRWERGCPSADQFTKHPGMHSTEDGDMCVADVEVCQARRCGLHICGGGCPDCFSVCVCRVKVERSRLPGLPLTKSRVSTLRCVGLLCLQSAWLHIHG